MCADPSLLDYNNEWNTLTVKHKGKIGPECTVKQTTVTGVTISPLSLTCTTT